MLLKVLFTFIKFIRDQYVSGNVTLNIRLNNRDIMTR